MTYRELKTEKGHQFFEVSSAFQKAIRRGLEDEAMYWAVELSNSNYEEYLWKRMKIITCEDIGLAAPHLPAQINGLYEWWKEQKKKTKQSQPSERLFITQAVIMLCRAPKSRLICHASIYHFRTHQNRKLEVPDYALDQHTRRGKAMRRGIDHFWKEGAKLSNEMSIDRDAEYLERAKQTLADPQGNLFTDEP